MSWKQRRGQRAGEERGRQGAITPPPPPRACSAPPPRLRAHVSSYTCRLPSLLSWRRVALGQRPQALTLQARRRQKKAARYRARRSRARGARPPLPARLPPFRFRGGRFQHAARAEERGGREEGRCSRAGRALGRGSAVDVASREEVPAHWLGFPLTPLAALL